jgi:hypothetical protein
MERKRASKGHSQTVERESTNELGHRKKASRREVLTNWRAERERQVRTANESEQAKGAYKLENGEGRTRQGNERVRASQWHSRSAESRGGGSRQETETMRARERGVLTSYRA